jgi:hypothetical protein
LSAWKRNGSSEPSAQEKEYLWLCLLDLLVYVNHFARSVLKWGMVALLKDVSLYVNCNVSIVQY